MSSACFTASTYDLVAACCACVGSATLIILALFASIAPEPFGFREMFPFVFVLDNSLPFKVKLSAITAPPVIFPVAVTFVRPAKEAAVAPRFTVVLPRVTLELSI